MFRVMLLIPPQTSYVGASAHQAVDKNREHRPWLGILSVATSLQKACPDVELKFVDGLAEELTLEGLKEKVGRFQPDLVGITSLTFTYRDCLRSAAAVKSVCPDARVCVGGFHATLYPRESLAQRTIDFVVVGEGERTFVELVEVLRRGAGSLDEIRGLGHKQGERPAINGQRAVVANLEEIPHVDYRCVDVHRYSHVLGRGVNLALESSRGCPFRCAFCDVGRTRFRFRSAATMIDTVEGLHARGVRSLFFVDDNFTVKKARAVEICQGLAARSLEIDFKVSARVDTVDEELMHHLKAAGCTRISLGVESCRQNHLDYLQKGVTIEQTVRTLEAARRVGLPVFAYVMLGFPGQTRSEMLDEVAFLKANRVEYASFSVLTIYPKTPLYHRSLADGSLKHDPWPAFAQDPEIDIEPPTVNGVHSRCELQEIQLEVSRRFYFSPRSLWNRVREVRSWSDLRRRAGIGLRLLRG